MIRTAQLQGKCYPESIDVPVNIDVYFNHELVFSGPVEKSQTPNEHEFGTVLTWNFDISVYGDIPLSIIVKNGNFQFVDVFMNYVGDELTVEFKDDAIWPIYVPIDIDELKNDYQLDDESFFTKYNLTKHQSKNNIEEILKVTTDQNFSHVNRNTAESDGKNSVVINGILQSRMLIDSNQTGDWHYLIQKDERLDCVFTVSAPSL